MTRSAPRRGSTLVRTTTCGRPIFPHTDSTWPNSLEVIKKDFAKVPPEVTQKIVFDNAVKLYRMA